MKKNYKKVLMALILSSTLMTTSCKSEEIKVENQEEISTEEVNTIVEELSLDDYKEYFSEDIKFRNDEFYDDVHLFDEIAKNDCEFIYHNITAFQDVLDKIKDNSKKYQKEEYISAWDEIDSDLLDNLVMNNLHKIIDDPNSSQEDLHLLNDLKIVCGSKEHVFKRGALSINLNYASYYDRDANMIIIDNNILKSFYDKPIKEEVAKKLYENYLYECIYANFNVLRQNSCVASSKAPIYENEAINSLSFGAAFSYAYINNKENADLINSSLQINKPNETYDESDILLLSIFNNDKDAIDNYYNSLFNEDYVKLYEILNLKDEKDINNFKKIVKAMDAKNLRNDYVMYYGDLNDLTNVPFSVGYEYKLLIYNMFVNNMIDYMKDNNITWKENLVLYNIVLNELVKNAYKNYEDGLIFDSEKDIVFDQDFITQIYDEDLKYKEMLCNYYNISMEDIEKFTSFNDDYEIEYDNIIKSLHEDAKEEKSNEYFRKYPMLKLILRQVTPTSYDYKKILELTNLKK